MLQRRQIEQQFHQQPVELIFSDNGSIIKRNPDTPLGPIVLRRPHA
jgi:hypothetical protein